MGEQLAGAREALSQAREELAETKRALSEAREALAEVTKELSETKEALAGASEELAAARGELEVARADLASGNDKLSAAVAAAAAAVEAATAAAAAPADPSVPTEPASSQLGLGRDGDGGNPVASQGSGPGAATPKSGFTSCPTGIALAGDGLTIVSAAAADACGEKGEPAPLVRRDGRGGGVAPPLSMKADVGAAALERELENANERLGSLMQELALAQQAAAAAEAAGRVPPGGAGATTGASPAEERLIMVERELSLAGEKLAESEREHAQTSKKLALLVRLQEASESSESGLPAEPSSASALHAAELAALEASRVETLRGRLEDAERDAATSKAELVRVEGELASLGASRGEGAVAGRAAQQAGDGGFPHTEEWLASAGEEVGCRLGGRGGGQVPGGGGGRGWEGCLFVRTSI